MSELKSTITMQQVEIEKIKYNESNPRYINSDDFERLKKSLQDFPEMLELRPVVLNSENVVLGGNMRLKALSDLGYKEIPVAYASDLTEEQQAEFIVKDNVGLGSWDWDRLANEWDDQKLIDWGLDVDFSNGTEKEAKEDDYEEPEEVQTSIEIGDLIQIGEHRLLCGDSTNSTEMDKLMGSEKADMVIADPPYDIEFTYQSVLSFSENCNVFIFNNDRALVNQLKNSPLEFKKFFVFHHGGTAIPQEGGNEVFLDHILVAHEINGSPKVRFNKGDGTRSVIKGQYRKSESHKHEKPASFLNPIIKGYSNEGFIVLDLFSGGGSMFSAAHLHGRVCYGVDISPKYCQVVVDRMQNLDPNLSIKINGKEYNG